MQQNGIVIKTQHNLATVAIQQKSACGNDCACCGGCNTSKCETVALNPLNAQKGDKVKVDTPASKVYLAALLAYVFPSIIAVVLLALNQPAATVISLVSYFITLHFCDKFLAKYLKGTIIEIFK